MMALSTNATLMSSFPSRNVRAAGALTVFPLSTLICMYNMYHSCALLPNDQKNQLTEVRAGKKLHFGEFFSLHGRPLSNALCCLEIERPRNT